ncbi:MAG: tRNA (adenosine(37)-N6)-dimethylallyltransferase MiaA [Chloroflexi bacterium]|nr:tRNA (adenosine(37)-N6)-dimethylallyltransferase MiaA [Chloroflexota bacterium]
MSNPRPSIIVITGPTAVGKTALALAVARHLDAEIVSADSRQIYHYMDVGTGKPTTQERAAVPHHMVNVAYPDRPYSIVDYRQGGERALADIARRGRRALVVGGSPHYLAALLDRLEPPPVNLALRAWLEQADGQHPGRLDAWLRALDPASADRIETRNRRRVIRAIEATLTVGRPFSTAQGAPRAIDARWFGLRMERPALYARVDRRIAQMIEAGWLNEVRILGMMGFGAALPSLSATGYPELLEVLQGEQSLDSAVERIRYATHAFVRRQETWLRRESRIHWLDSEADNLVGAFMAAVDGGTA